MNDTFHTDFPKFKAKIHNFVVSQNFVSKVEYYDRLLHEMASVSPDDMKSYVERSPSFLQLRNESMKLMERIVDLHQSLNEIFKMEEEELGKRYDYNLEHVDQTIAEQLKEAAALIHRFNIVSEKGRQAIEQVDSPFFSQAL